MVVACLVEFDNNPHGIYFAGQMLSGKITLQSDKVKRVQGVALKINGYAKTRWTESHTTGTGDNRKTRTTTYHGREDYIASITYLVGCDGSNLTDLQPGIHTYTFACHLPINCPSSFEGMYGVVRYTVKVALIRPWKFDQTYTKGFTVLKMVDLNYDSPLLRMPTQSAAQKVYCCGPFKSDPLKILVTLSQSGYVPGQNIPVNVLISNDSRVPVEEVKVSLKMNVNYYSQLPRSSLKSVGKTISKLKSGAVPRNITKSFTYELPVPATPPTCFNACRIIQIAYEIQVETKVKGIHANQIICVPVTIGNVPLMSVVQQQPSGSVGEMQYQQQRAMLSEADAPNGQIENNAEMFKISQAVSQTPTAPWSADANIPPPNYEEAVHMQHGKINEDEDHDYGESDFAPRYPVFKLESVTVSNGSAGYEGNTEIVTATASEVETNNSSVADNGTWL